MNLDEYCGLDGVALGELIKNKEILPTELAQLAKTAAKNVEDNLNASVEIFETPISRPSQSSGPLAGVPMFLKDILATIDGVKQECGSRLLKDTVSETTSHFSRRILDAGLQVIGRSSCPEFGLTLTTESTAEGITRNPWNLNKIAGGSSGGSAALVAAGVIPVAHTNDGGGSTRVPASACGNLGLKTSRGLVSLGPRLNDVLAPLVSEGCNSRTVRDTAAFLDIVSGPESGDAVITAKPEREFLSQHNISPKTLRIAVCGQSLLGNIPLEGFIHSELERVAQVLTDLGHEVELYTPTFFADGQHVVNAFKTLWLSLAAASIGSAAINSGKTPSVETLEPVTLKMYEAGLKVSAIEKDLALSISNGLAHEVAEFFNAYDLLLTPTFISETPDVKSNITLTSDLSLDDWFYNATSHVPHPALANLTGIPAISIPCALAPDGMPLGMQFFAPLGHDLLLLQIAHQIEQAIPWINRRPPIYVSSLN